MVDAEQIDVAGACDKFQDGWVLQKCSQSTGGEELVAGPSTRVVVEGLFSPEQERRVLR